MFRWDETSPGEWIGVDGPNWFRVDASNPCRLRVVSNAGESGFRRLFRLDEDLSAHLKAIVRCGPEIAPYIAQLPGLRVMKPCDVVEETFCFLCTPNNNLARILKMARELTTYGEKFDGAGVYRFPMVERIAEIEEKDLRSKGFGYRAQTIPSIARQIVERGGESWLTSLQGATYREAHDELLAIKGIGSKARRLHLPLCAAPHRGRAGRYAPVASGTATLLSPVAGQVTDWPEVQTNRRPLPRSVWKSRWVGAPVPLLRQPLELALV